MWNEVTFTFTIIKSAPRLYLHLKFLLNNILHHVSSKMSISSLLLKPDGALLHLQCIHSLHKNQPQDVVPGLVKRPVYSNPIWRESCISDLLTGLWLGALDCTAITPVPTLFQFHTLISLSLRLDRIVLQGTRWRRNIQLWLSLLWWI